MLTTIFLFSGCNKKKTENLIQFANPLIETSLSSVPNAVKHNQGSKGWSQDIPAVSTPFGMTQWTPQTRDTENKCVSPYYFGGKAIQGLRGSHWLGGSCTQDYNSSVDDPDTYKDFDRVELNGNEISFVLQHEDIRKGGKLKFSNSEKYVI